jgi:hypothetical protein
MSKTLAEALALIQDPEARAVLDQTVSSYTADKARLDALEAQLRSNELVDRTVANGWREFDAKKKPAIENELKTLREKVATLEPEAQAAVTLRKQLEGDGKTAIDPKDMIPALRTEFLSASDRQAIVREAVAQATQQVNFGSLPMAIEIVESTSRARREYGLDIPAGQFSEAVTRFGGVNQAYSALTAEAAGKKATADREAQAAAHAAEVAKAKEEGIRLGRAEADTRAYNPEESGSGAYAPMVPPQDKPDMAGVNPQAYNPSDGALAREASKLLQKQEADGVWGSPTSRSVM